MRRFRLAATAVLVGLVSAIGFASRATAATVPVPIATTMNATRIELDRAPNTGSTIDMTARSAPAATASLQAFVVDWHGNRLPNIVVTFAILDGPNAGQHGTSAQTGPTSLVAPFTYSQGSEPGVDVVQATFTDGLEIHKSNRLFVTWHNGAPARTIESPATIQVGPTCFQPATAAARASDVLRGVKAPSTAHAAESSTVHVTGANFNPYSAVLITFDAGPGGRPQSFQTQTDVFGSFSRDIQVSEPQEGPHLVRADDFKQREAQTVYSIPCSQGSIALDPPIGPPGFVTMVVGRNFPRDSSITLLNWTKPDLLSPFPKGPISTGHDGTFQFPVLILYHDMLGPRTLRVLVTDGLPGEGGAVIEADAPFMVTLGRVQPPNFVTRR